MRLLDYVDQTTLQNMQDMFCNSTGLTAIILDTDGHELTKSKVNYNKGLAEQYKKDGLKQFSKPIVVNGEKFGILLGGETPNNIGKEILKKLSKDFQVDEAVLASIAEKISAKNQEIIDTAANMLHQMLTDYIGKQIEAKKASKSLDKLFNEITTASATVNKIAKHTHELESISTKQNILALNASIEAARSGEAGVGFAVVARQMGELSKKSEAIYSDIKTSSISISKSIETMSELLNLNKEK